MLDARSVGGCPVLVQRKHSETFGFRFKPDRDSRSNAERPRGGVVT